MDKYNIWWKNTDGSLFFGDGSTTSKEYKEATASEVTAWESRVVPPQSVTMRQARLALHQSGLLTTVDTAIANSTDMELKIEWEFATEVRRDWASLVSMATALGMTSSDLDNLFVLASTK